MNSSRVIPDIFADIMDALTTLVRKEIQLAKAEMSDKVGGIGMAIAVIATGGVLCLGGFLILLEGVVYLLVEAGFSPTTAALIVGAVVHAVGGAIVYAGLNRLQGKSLVPERTIHQLN